jgi:hypothetical protein
VRPRSGAGAGATGAGSRPNEPVPRRGERGTGWAGEGRHPPRWTYVSLLSGESTESGSSSESEDGPGAAEVRALLDLVAPDVAVVAVPAAASSGLSTLVTSSGLSSETTTGGRDAGRATSLVRRALLVAAPVGSGEVGAVTGADLTASDLIGAVTGSDLTGAAVLGAGVLAAGSRVRGEELTAAVAGDVMAGTRASVVALRAAEGAEVAVDCSRPADWDDGTSLSAPVRVSPAGSVISGDSASDGGCRRIGSECSGDGGTNGRSIVSSIAAGGGGSVVTISMPNAPAATPAATAVAVTVFHRWCWRCLM